MHWLMEGSGVVCATHPAPSWGQAPALHLSCDLGLPPARRGMKMGPDRWKCLGVVGATLPLWIPAFAGMTNSVAGTIHPGSESGTCFPTNRPCRLAPAHQGVKTRSCDLVWRVGTVDSATPHPDPSGGQAPALHFLVPPSIIGLQFGTFRRWRAGIEVDWGAHFRTNDEWEGIPTDAGMTIPTVMAGTVHPGSESGTCFPTNRHRTSLTNMMQQFRFGCISLLDARELDGSSRHSGPQ